MASRRHRPRPDPAPGARGRTGDTYYVEQRDEGASAFGPNAQIIINRYDSPGPPKKTTLQALVSLIDRTEQYETTRKAYLKAWTSKRPLLVFVAGSDRQYVNQFYYRFRWFVVPMVEHNLPGESLDVPSSQDSASHYNIKWPDRGAAREAIDKLWEELALTLHIPVEDGSRQKCASESRSLCELGRGGAVDCDAALRAQRAKLVCERLNQLSEATVLYVSDRVGRIGRRDGEIAKEFALLWDEVGKIGLTKPATIFVSIAWIERLSEKARRVCMPHSGHRPSAAERTLRKVLPPDLSGVEIAMLNSLGDVHEEHLEDWTTRLITMSRTAADQVMPLGAALNRDFSLFSWTSRVKRSRPMLHVYTRLLDLARTTL